MPQVEVSGPDYEVHGGGCINRNNNTNTIITGVYCRGQGCIGGYDWPGSCPAGGQHILSLEKIKITNRNTAIVNLNLRPLRSGCFRRIRGCLQEAAEEGGPPAEHHERGDPPPHRHLLVRTFPISFCGCCGLNCFLSFAHPCLGVSSNQRHLLWIDVLIFLFHLLKV